MKNSNLIKRLWTDSHEKQSPQRFARYAAILIMLLTLGVGQMWAGNKRIYCKMEYSWWTADGAAVGAHYWGGSSGTTWPGKRMTALPGESNVWYIDVPDDHSNIVFVRVNGSGTIADWGAKTVDLSIGSTTNNFFTITNSTGSWGDDNKCNGTWSNKQLASTGSVSASSTSITTAQTSTLTPSLTSNTAYNVIKSTAYSVTTNPGSAGSVTSGGVFSATAAGTYTVTATITYNALGFSGITKTVSPTVTITVSAPAEATHTVAITYKCGATTVSTGTNKSIGEVTASSVSAPSVTGYTFSNWTLGTGISNQSANTSANPINVKTLSSGTYTMQANYTEDLTSTWYVVGTPTSIFAGASPWATDDDHNMVMKPSGSSTGSAGSVTFNVKALPANEDSYQFKVKNTSGDSWYGWGSDGNHYHVTRAANSLTLDGPENLYFRPDALGEYTFSVNWSSTPTLSVPFPTAYTVNFGQGTGTGGSASATYSSTSFSTGTKVQNGKSITLTAPSASSGYTWDGWYNASSGGTKVSTSNPLTTTVSSTNYNFYARYTETTHTVTLANGGHGHVEINSATVTSVSGVGIATASGTITAVPDPGYYFTGWTGAIGSGVTLASGTTSSASITINATADSKTITANFAPIWRIEGGNSDSPDAMGDWSTTANQITNITASAGVMTSGYVEINLPANTDFEFKVYNASTKKHWGKTSTVTKIEYSNRATSVTLSDDTGNNQTFRTAAAGTYRFTWTDSQITISYPTSYKVTFGKGTGGLTITASGNTTGSLNSGDYVASGEDITFTETHTTGYTLTGWYTTKDTGGSSVTGMSTSDLVLDDIAADATVWSRYSENMTTVNLVASPTGKGTFTCGGDAVTSVSAGVTTHPAVTAVAGTGYLVNTSATVWSESSDYISLSGTSTNPTTITATGTTGNSATLTATFTPKTYTITLNQNGATTESDPTSLTATYDGRAGGASDQFTLTNPEKTGYTFAGWYENEGGSGAEIITTAQYYKWEDNPYVTTTGLWQHDGNVTVYAKWTPNNYAVTLSTTSETGYGSSAPANQTAIYGADMPTITPPVGAPGYKFQGYFTEANGLGTKYYNADGTSAHAWDKASATTLHAYFLEAEITSLEHESSVAKADVAELVVNPVLNVVPENYIAICWTLHYADNDNPVDAEHWSVAAYPEEGTKPKQVKYTFTNLANGNYYVKATLRKSASAFSNVCTDGTKMMDIHGDFHVVGNNTVTVRYMTTDLSSDFVLKAPTEVVVEAMNTVEVTAPEIPGYTFTRWSIGDGISTSDAVTANPITISATYDGVLTARYTKKQMIYFNNTLGWDTVYVYFYNNGNYWGDANQGTGSRTDAYDGAYTGKHGGMTKIAGTNIYYFDLAANSVSLSLTNVAFTEKEQIDELYFSANNVIGRGDYSAALSMYVPLAGVDPVTKNGTGEYQSFYYEKGYWMNYPESTGYELRFYNKRASDGSGEPYELIAKRHKFEFTGDKTLPLSVSLDLEAGHDYFFKVYRVDGTYYGNDNQMTNGHSGDEGQPAWEFKTGTENAWVTASGAGNYTFTLTYGIDLSSNYNYLVGVRYPESTGDFRVLYSDAVRVSTHESDEGKSWLASYVIPKTSESDTVSYFVRSASSPKIKAQKCTATYEDETTTVTWTDENEGVDLLPDTISADGVYNFIFTKSGDNLVLSAVEPYTGNFYIRVDGAGSSNWDNFRAADHLMPYSDYSFHQTENPYSHYFTQWYEPNPEGKPVEPKNIKFVVANDYSACVSDTIVRDGIADNYVDANGWLSGRNANIRFMYNYKTNVASRRYIDGAQESGSEFLVLLPSNNESIYNAETEGTAYPQVTFTDKGNWIYEANVWVVPGTEYKLRSKFGDGDNIITQYFKGDEDTYEKLIEGSGSSRLQIRLLYDFKTNRLVSAYIPSSTISGNLAINADVMFIREGQGEMQQLTFENNATLSAIKNVYSVLRFNKWTLNNRYTDGGHGLILDPKSIYERSLYFVSFPFDVKLSDVFGFGTYWDEWYIEYYDGAARAKNGFWIDSDSYWKYVTPAMKDTFTLKAGQGYIFGLDLDYLECHGEEEGEQANIWKNIQTADFIFPGNVSSISNSSVTYTLPAHTCTINRGTANGNRTIADSHWNVLGVPTYLNTTSVTFEETTGDWMTDGKPKYIYSWNPQDNSLSATSAAGFTYHSMNAYVVQYYGNVTFSTSVSPIAAPRRNPEYRGEYEFRLEIQQNEQAIDHAFIRLTDDEEATVNFEFGLDLTKSINANKANIYTIVEGYLQAAGNCLPLTDQTTVVPVGVKIAADGDYTFSIPEGTEGVGVTLIDNETGIRTSLSALDYNINLSAGTYDNRFILEISPIQQKPTNIDNVQGESAQSAKARKVLIDGLLYIVKDGKIFDAQGKRLQ